MATKKTETVAVPEFKPRRMVLEIVGKSELICNRITDEVKAGLPGGKKPDAPKDKDTRKPEAIAMDVAYRHPETGEYVFPAAGLMNSVASAGHRMGLWKDAVSLYANLQIPDEWLVINGAVPHARHDTARNKNAKDALIVANRAAYPVGWWMRVLVEFNAAVFTPAKVGMLFEAAGFGVGIGCWRPEKKGRFGRFTLRRQPTEKDAKELQQ